MRFTLRHLLTIQAVVAVIFGLNLLVGSQLSSGRCVYIFLVVVTGTFWGIWRYHKKHPGTVVAPILAALKGLGLVLILAFALGYLLGVERHEICTRSHYSRTIRNVGLFGWTSVERNSDAIFIEEKLGYRPRERHYVPTVEYSLFSISDWMPSSHWPTLALEREDLEALAKLSPLEKCHPFFEAADPLNHEFWHLRGKVIQEFQQSCPRGDASAVEAWWQDHEALLRPWPNNEALRKSLVDFWHTQSYQRFPAFWDEDLAPLKQKAGL